MKLKHIKLAIVTVLVLSAISCKKYLDINQDPDNILDAPLPQLLTSAQVNLGFEGGSDLFRYTSLLAQQMSGQASQPNQTYEYDRYNITGSDQNNLWSSMYSTTLSDLELIIKKASTSGSPYYVGVAKILKAYEYQKAVDTWGDIPYSEAQQLDQNTKPKYDKGEDIYKAITTLLTDAVTDLNAPSSALSPTTNSVIYTAATFPKANWIKLANTLRLRIYLHYTKKDAAFAVAQMTALINSAGTNLFSSNADNFQMPFFNLPKQQNPIQQFEANRANYLFANQAMVSIMNTKNDPRRAFYFTPFPWGSTSYKGVTPGETGQNFSRIHTYLRGAATGVPVPNAAGGITADALTYTGAAPIRFLTYAEYCFIRAEGALRGAPGDAQTWFTNGITASMTDAGVVTADITTYLAANGTLAGTTEEKIKQVLEEKYVALFGTTNESWTDFRRTGYPAITAPSNAVVNQVPRSMYYPQSEIDLNPNCPGQKANLQAKIFWD